MPAVAPCDLGVPASLEEEGATPDLFPVLVNAVFRTG